MRDRSKWWRAQPPATNDNLDPDPLQEVEVDSAGNVYVLNCHYVNSGDILWVYRNDGTGELGTSRVETQDLASLQEIGISAPVGLCVSSYDPSKLYVLSKNDLSLSRMIEVRNMGHITDIAENPTDGAVCIAGFIMPVIYAGEATGSLNATH